jgi:hypothetical protein
MAATYTSLPVSIPSIMKAIVSEVETNLIDEASLDIPRVSFKCETWIKLMERLSKESQVATFDEAKYPLVALLRNFDEKYKANTDLVEVSLTLVIVTPSTPTKESEDREVDNYTPILYPIYAELMSVLAESPYFLGYGISIEHTKTDNMHLGVDGTQGNTKYLLPDCVDGIIISGLKLGVVPSRCVGFNYGPPVQLTYLNNVAELSISVTNFTIGVTLNNAQYINGVVPTPSYYLYYPISSQADMGNKKIEEGGSAVLFQTVSLEDGNYYGYVLSDDGTTRSTLYFGFYVKSGNAVKCTTFVKHYLNNFVVSGVDYSDYPFDVTHKFIYSNKNIQQIELTSNGGNVQYQQFFAPYVLDTTQITTTINQEKPLSPTDITYTVLVYDQYLNSQSFYKTN